MKNRIYLSSSVFYKPTKNKKMKKINVTVLEHTNVKGNTELYVKFENNGVEWLVNIGRKSFEKINEVLNADVRIIAKEKL